MKKNISEREYSKKVTEAAIFAIDTIKRKRMKGLIHDNEISVKLGCAPQTIHYLRTGSRSITLDQLGALIKEFDIHPNFLMKQEGTLWGEAEMITRIKLLEERLDTTESRVKKIEKKLQIDD